MERIIATKAKEQEALREKDPEAVVNVDPNLFRILGHLHLLLENFPKGRTTLNYANGYNASLSKILYY